MNIKTQVLNLSIFITIASTTLYIVFRNFPREVSSFAYLWAPITLFLIFITYPATFIKGPMRYLLFYGILMIVVMHYVLWKHMSDWNHIRILFEFYYLVILTAILVFYWSINDFRRLALIGKWTFIIMIITLITTNIALFIDPNIVRQSASTANFTTLQKKIFNFSGAMGYSYLQAIVLLIPIIIYHIKNRMKMVFSPTILKVVLLIILITQVRSQVFANILVTAVITGLSFLGLKKIRTLIITILVFGLIFVVLPSSLYVDTLESFSTYFNPDSEMYAKLIDFAEYIENPYSVDSTGAGRRASRYPLLYKALSANPILGDSSYNSPFKIAGGAHLYWMNRLTLWGVPGFLFFVFILFRVFRTISFLFDSEYKVYYFLSIAALFLMGLLKAVGGREPWLMLVIIIPGIYFLPLLQKKVKNKAGGLK